MAEDMCSMVLPETSQLPLDCRWNEEWLLIRIGCDVGVALGFDQCGIVYEFTKPLDRLGITLCYMSTFLCDYILVSKSEYEASIVALQGEHCKC